LIGLNETARFNNSYSEITGEGFMINFIGLLLIVFGSLVIYMVTKGSWKREDCVKDELKARQYEVAEARSNSQ
jgi:hypothetical protein